MAANQQGAAAGRTGRYCPYGVLGLSSSASKEQVKDAFRKLCMEYHPDRCKPELKPVAGARFREIKSAYDVLLKMQAGYSPPPPGAAPSEAYQKAYDEYQRRARSSYGASASGRTFTPGPYGGFHSEWAFYRALMANQRNPMIFIAASLVVIPAITGILSLVNGRAEWFAKVKNQGINIFSNDFWSVNGRTMRRNPYLVDGLDDMKSSYIYKHEKYKHLRQQYDGDSKPAAAGEAAPSGA